MAMTDADLRAFGAYLRRTRRRAFVFSLNWSFAIVPRHVVIATVCAECMDRGIDP